MKYSILLLTIFCASLYTQAQWYFETGLNDSKFSEFVNVNGTKTTLHSYNGLRDFSYAVGYVFPMQSLAERLEFDAKPSVFRFGVGLGFDQMNLRTQADFSGSKVPVHYNLSQVQGHLNLLFTPTIITKKRADALGVRRPAVNLLVEAGASFNLYTNAVRSFTTNKGFITDLREDDEFVDSYPAFSFGGGLEFPLNRYATLYGKYVFENAFSTSDNVADGAAEQTFSTVKRRLVLGLRTDFRLKRKLKDIQEKRITALERDTVDLSPLHTKIKALEDELQLHKHKNEEVPQPVNPVVNEDTYKVQQHNNGFMYLPDFKHVLFPLNSSYFDTDAYYNRLRDLAIFMQQNPHLTLKLVGYADGKTGSKAVNIRLSELRAKRVYDFLLTQGVPAYVMSHFGAGETLQFSIDELTKNRRTEIIIMNK